MSGAYGTLGHSEIGHSLAEDKAVVGLETWDLNPPDGTNDEIIRATNPEDAVERESHGHSPRQSAPMNTRAFGMKTDNNGLSFRSGGLEEPVSNVPPPIRDRGSTSFRRRRNP